MPWARNRTQWRPLTESHPGTRRRVVVTSLHYRVHRVHKVYSIHSILLIYTEYIIHKVYSTPDTQIILFLQVRVSIHHVVSIIHITIYSTIIHNRYVNTSIRAYCFWYLVFVMTGACAGYEQGALRTVLPHSRGQLIVYPSYTGCWGVVCCGAGLTTTGMVWSRAICLLWLGGLRYLACTIR